MKKKYIFIMILLISITPAVYAQSPQADVETVTIRNADVNRTVMVGGAGSAQGVAIHDVARPTNMMFFSPGVMLGKLFPPELIMRNQDKLNLTQRQINAIKNEMKTFQSGIVDIQWDLNDAQSKLENEMGNGRIDEDRALALVDSVMKAENDLKKSHLALLIRINNILDDPQRQELGNLTGLHAGTMAMPVPAPYTFMRWQQAR
jgi:Spy/CpxP family protein refolding chaperone